MNNWEYMRNASFAKEYTYPLVSGLVSWWSCFLQRSTSANGSLLLNDWNPIDLDESAENEPVHNPMTGLAFAKRLANFQITLSTALFPGQPAPPDALEIVQHLTPFPLAPDAPASRPVWSSWRNHSDWVQQPRARVEASPRCGSVAACTGWPHEGETLRTAAPRWRSGRTPRSSRGCWQN